MGGGSIKSQGQTTLEEQQEDWTKIKKVKDERVSRVPHMKVRLLQALNLPLVSGTESNKVLDWIQNSSSLGSVQVFSYPPQEDGRTKELLDSIYDFDHCGSSGCWNGIWKCSSRINQSRCPGS